MGGISIYNMMRKDCDCSTMFLHFRSCITSCERNFSGHFYFELCSPLAVYACTLNVSFFFFKHKTAYERRISDWSSDVCSSDLRDLDIDLIIRAIDARAIVDEVGVDPSALRREGDARGLRHAQIGAFADDADAQILGIDAQRVVGGIADLGIILARRLQIGADAAEPQQVDRRLEDRRDQRGRLDLRLRQAEDSLHLGGQRDALLAAREDAAALRDQLLVIIVPARPRQLEQAVALLPAFRRIGIGVEEDVAVVERGDQPDRSEEHTSELQSLMRTSYAGLCL